MCFKPHICQYRCICNWSISTVIISKLIYLSASSRPQINTIKEKGEKEEDKEEEEKYKLLSDMKIASFNVQRFGMAKVSDPDVLSTLVKIVSRYDLILILEVVDVSGRSVKVLLEELNRVNTAHHYALQLSSRLGRSRYKEQFLFLYRDDVVDLIDCYQYEDNQVNDVDAFAREPYILHFKPRNTELKDIVLIPVHTKPEDSEKELDELYEVFLAVRDKWKTDNIMILGDFNADGAYVTHKGMKAIRIHSDKNFHWLIGDDVDTTANTSNEHTYDRIVVYGEEMLAAMVPNSAKPFNFHKEFAMTEEMALRVSDHYPVEVELRKAPPFWEVSSYQRRDSVDTQRASDNRAVTGILQVDMMELQKENLLLKREKLQLQILLLKHRVAKLQLSK
ncbi:deoxyribonuclease gamma-like isoform X2 [Acanthopagrus latus]|uniref:deoxyribonuclease gamma-like isoform X2 n=1 Tax=Acanthopagrus latus TaxID=8177 RepID=UPI00187BE0A7|nr:deoxyribonuclease gamma-like isoform X2 [Acanthopagrus latus]